MEYESQKPVNTIICLEIAGCPAIGMVKNRTFWGEERNLIPQKIGVDEKFPYFSIDFMIFQVCHITIKIKFPVFSNFSLCFLQH